MSAKTESSVSLEGSSFSTTRGTCGSLERTARNIVFSSFRLPVLRKSKLMTSVRYHVLDSVEEWLAIVCDSVETVNIQETKVPRFEFNIKIVNTPKSQDVYISSCAIAALKGIKDYVQSNNIVYKPCNHIKFAFDYIDSVHCYKLSDAPKVKRKYPQPADYHVALAVATQLFDTRDIVGGESEDLVVYYYLSVLRAVNHPVINHALFVVNDNADKKNVYNSALIPKCERPNFSIDYYSLYADLIYFLSMLAPPICVGDNVPSITAKIRSRNEEQLRILCCSVGITKYKPIHRGQGWQKLIRFLEANPLLGHVLATTILKSLEVEFPLTIIENQVIHQIKELWQWSGLYSFRDCYEFAINNNTKAVRMPAIADQCELVKKLHQKLETAVAKRPLIPFAKLLVEDAYFFDQYDERNYPELLYATRSSMTKNKSGDALWEEFVATRAVTIPREEIDEKLTISLPAPLLQENGKIISSCSDKVDVDRGRYANDVAKINKDFEVLDVSLVSPVGQYYEDMKFESDENSCDDDEDPESDDYCIPGNDKDFCVFVYGLSEQNNASSK